MSASLKSLFAQAPWSEKPKVLPVDLGKAIALLLNRHSRPLLFRHTHVLQKIVSFYSENDHALDLIMDDIIAFVIMCRQVSLEQQVSDDEFDQALKEAVAFSWYHFVCYIYGNNNYTHTTFEL